MKVIRSLAHAAVILACVGMITPRAAFSAGPAPKISHDVCLSAGGAFSGVIVNAEGRPLDGAVVSVRQNGKEISKTVTTAQGAFSINGLGGGVYEVAVGPQVIPVRAWTVESAPPSAQEQAVIVIGNATRGQGTIMGLDLITLWTLTASTGALVLAAVNQSDLNDVEDKVDQLLQSP